MNNKPNSFIEVACSQISEKGQSVSGDVYLKERYNGHTIFVLSDGAGSGIRANVIASVIASMALNNTKVQRPMTQTARAVIETFARGQHSDDLMQATFTIVDISDNGEVNILEFANPEALVIRNRELVPLPRQRQVITVGRERYLAVYLSNITMEEGDRIIIYSDGVTLSGYGTRRMPEGWGDDGLKSRLLEIVSTEPNISAADLSRNIILDCEANELFAAKNDMTCASVYFRKPRKILICSGPPYNEQQDKELTDIVFNYKGSKIICGGTTSQIISRESGKEISVIMKRDPSRLPSASMMEGVDMITEGVLTLSKVRLMLRALKSDYVTGPGIDSKFVRMLLSHDIIDFIVGTKVNAMHHAPNLPMELELRRNIIKDIAKLLEDKFMKQVNIKYI